MVPSGRLLWLLLAVVVLSALPTVVHVELWVAVVATWGALLVGASLDLFVLSGGAPLVHVDAPRTAGVGDPVKLGVRLSRSGRPTLVAALRAEVEEPLLPAKDGLVRVPRGESSHRLEIMGPRRGRGVVRALWTRLEGPLGLFRRIDRHRLDYQVSIIPNMERVRELALQHFGAHPYQGGIRVEQRVGFGGEFDAMSEYAAGMDLRHVDWKSSARHHSLRVRQYRMERNQRLLLCVDTGRLMSDPIDGIQRLDHAIHASMLLSRVALRSGDLVGLHAYADEPQLWVPPTSGIRHVSHITQACARLHASPVETNHVVGMHRLLSKLRRRALIVVFTEFTDSTTAELMVEHVGHIARRHLVVFVAIDDPVVEEPLSVLPRTAEDLAESVVAGALRQDRRRVLRRLQRMGVHVVHGPPGRATLDLLSRYVRIKKRGLIG